MFHVEDALDLGRYTMEARRAVAYAAQSVRRANGDAVTPEHIVVGLLHPDVRASEYVRTLGGDPELLQRRLTEAIRPKGSSKSPSALPMDETVKGILRNAYGEASAEGRKLTSVDILAAVLSDESLPAARPLLDSRLGADALRQALKADPDREKWIVE